MNKSIIPIIDTPEAMTRLIWMRDYEPQNLLRLHEQGLLRKNVETTVEFALSVKSNFITKHNMIEEAAQEIIVSLLAPFPDSPRKPSEICESKFQSILMEIRTEI
ncbi:MAG: hypothetical protein H8E34_05375 [Bacteroidetes bacterium]|nr:hypothetical protein [Bacteroidota bacterium]MBL6944310.1 hypothetical protein [Bacteroidales bacterium]